MDDIDYKGRVISHFPAIKPETQKWTLSVRIRTSQGGNFKWQEFFGNDTYDTKEEAYHHSIEFGKQIIDGKYPEYDLTEPS